MTFATLFASISASLITEMITCESNRINIKLCQMILFDSIRYQIELIEMSTQAEQQKEIDTTRNILQFVWMFNKVFYCNENILLRNEHYHCFNWKDKIFNVCINIYSIWFSSICMCSHIAFHTLTTIQYYAFKIKQSALNVLTSDCCQISLSIFNFNQ